MLKWLFFLFTYSKQLKKRLLKRQRSHKAHNLLKKKKKRTKAAHLHQPPVELPDVVSSTSSIPPQPSTSGPSTEASTCSEVSVRRTSARLALKQPPCTCEEQVIKGPGKRCRAPKSTDPPRKRQRTEAARPTSQPSTLQPSSAHPLVSRPPSTISPADLPAVCLVAPGPQPSTAALQEDTPLKIHNLSVEEYQKVYHEVVDGMLRYKNGRHRPYSLRLGHQIKQKLWERLNHPIITETADENGLMMVDVSYGRGVSPPLYFVDTSEEPEPKIPQIKTGTKNKILPAPSSLPDGHLPAHRCNAAEQRPFKH
ncbi:uncharacterized protein LOC108242542 [Kryptolebias marmoratus]|uniref:uncharacterized protein LOC108242542 n=1 Tax=Kryptolebias marmoratus TaxID=37003 RepID=UPI0007F8D1AD|nr:uncharacterized protein LOC108242542 [Kryptolebias marmoratus]XP_037835523.1 uncharacterized protein LOC108242542 [Kryptolebias marmoratus]XP_037835524.1 uncharacterized protein LOC108242542 [Kryptolebias marmoratus]